MISSHNRFNFGRHYGRTAEQVADIDPTYIWHCENTMGVRFTPRVKRIARNAANRNLYNTGRANSSFNRPMFY